MVCTAGLAQLGFHQFVENVKKDGGRTLFRRPGPSMDEMVEFQPHVREHTGQLFTLFGVDSNGFITLERFVERVVGRPAANEMEPAQADASRSHQLPEADAVYSAPSLHDSAQSVPAAANLSSQDQRTVAPAPAPASTATATKISGPNIGGSAWGDAESYIARLDELQQVADTHDSLVAAAATIDDRTPMQQTVSETRGILAERFDQTAVPRLGGRPDTMPTTIRSGFGEWNADDSESVASGSEQFIGRLHEEQQWQRQNGASANEPGIRRNAMTTAAPQLVRGHSSILRRPLPAASPAAKAQSDGHVRNFEGGEARQPTNRQQSQSRSILQGRMTPHLGREQAELEVVAPYDAATDSTTVDQITARLDNLQADIQSELQGSGSGLVLMGGAGKHVDVREAVKVIQVGLQRYGNEKRWRSDFHRFDIEGSSGGGGGNNASQVASSNGLTSMEFVQLLRREETRLSSDMVSDATLSRLFEVFDLNGDRVLSFDEFRALFHYRPM